MRTIMPSVCIRPKPSMPFPKKFRNDGFTVIELLVAAAITLVVLGLMLQVTFSVLKTFDKVTGSLGTKTQATTALDYLRRDFQSIVWKRDNNVWLLATIQPDQTTRGGRGDTNLADAMWDGSSSPVNPKPGNANPGEDYSSLRLEKPGGTNDWMDLDEYRFGQAGVWLRFFTNQVTNDTSLAAPVAVSYQIVRIKPRTNSTEFRYQLFRSVVRPGPTDSTTRSVLRAGFNLATSASVNDSYNSTPTSATNDQNGDPGSIRKPDREVLLANNVIDFGVRFWQRDAASGALKMIFPSNNANPPKPDEGNLGFAVTTLDATNITATGASGIPYGGLANSDLKTGYPDFVEVMIRVLTDEGARLLEAYENGLSVAPTPNGAAPTQNEKDAYWWTIALEHSEVFVERIPILARPF